MTSRLGLLCIPVLLFIGACTSDSNESSAPSVTATSSITTASAPPAATATQGPVAPTGLDAVPADDLFIAGLQSGGVQYADPETMKILGKGICSELTAGNPLIAEVDAVTTGSKGVWNQDAAGAIVGTAIGAYCPQFKALLPN